MTRFEEMILKTQIELDVLKDVKRAADDSNKFYTYAIVEGKIEAQESFLKTLKKAQAEIEQFKKEVQR